MPTVPPIHKHACEGAQGHSGQGLHDE